MLTPDFGPGPLDGERGVRKMVKRKGPQTVEAKAAEKAVKADRVSRRSRPHLWRVRTVGKVGAVRKVFIYFVESEADKNSCFIRIGL